MMVQENCGDGFGYIGCMGRIEMFNSNKIMDHIMFLSRILLKVYWRHVYIQDRFKTAIVASTIRIQDQRLGAIAAGTLKPCAKQNTNSGFDTWCRIELFSEKTQRGLLWV